MNLKERLRNQRTSAAQDLATVANGDLQEALTREIDLIDLILGDDAHLAIEGERDCIEPDNIPPILMQGGLRPDEHRNGYLDTEILAALAERLRGHQKGPMACRETAIAVTKIDEAVLWLRARVDRRKREATYGKQEEATQIEDTPKRRAISYMGNTA